MSSNAEMTTAGSKPESASDVAPRPVPLSPNAGLPEPTPETRSINLSPTAERFSGECNLFLQPENEHEAVEAKSNVIAPTRPSVERELPKSKAAPYQRRRQLSDAREGLIRLPHAAVAETSENLPVRRRESQELPEDSQLDQLAGGRRGQPTNVVSVVSEYISFLLRTAQSVFHRHVWQEMPHAPPSLPNDEAGGDASGIPPRKREAPSLGCVVPVAAVERAILKTETARLSRAAFPGAFVRHSVSHGVDVSGEVDVTEHLRVVASKALRSVSSELLSKWQCELEDGREGRCDEAHLIRRAAGGEEGPHTTTSVVLPREGLLVTLWRSRKAGKLFVRSVTSLNDALRCCQLPSAFQGLLSVGIALDGFLFTVTWLPQLLCVQPTLAAETSDEPSRRSSSAIRAATSLLSVFLVREEDPGGGGCIGAHPTADTNVLLVPDGRFLRELLSCRAGLHFASMLFPHCLPQHAAPKQRLLQMLRALVLQSDIDVRRQVDRKTLLRDVFHAAGAHMRSLLEVRTMFVTHQGFSEGKHGTEENVKTVVNLMLTECVARTLKAMILSKTSSPRGAQKEADASAPCSQYLCDVATDVLRRFATSKKFFHSSLLPAIAKKFPLGGGARGDGLVFDCDCISLPDIVSFLQHRLGIAFDSAARAFTPQTTLDSADAALHVSCSLALTLGAGRSASAAQLLWSTAYGADAAVDVALPGILCVSLKGRPGQVTMKSYALYAEGLMSFVGQKESLHPAAASCALMLAAYFAQTAVELKCPGAWSTSLAATDMRAVRHRRGLNVFCAATLSVLHDYVQQWIAVHRVLQLGVEEASHVTLMPASKTALSEGGTHSSPGEPSIDDESSSSGPASQTAAAGLRRCGPDDEVVFVADLAPHPASTTGEEKRSHLLKEMDVVWVLHLCGLQGLRFVVQQVQRAAQHVSKDASARHFVKAAQVLDVWAAALCASRLGTDRPAEIMADAGQWCSCASRAVAFDYMRAFRALEQSVALNGDGQKLHSVASPTIAAALIVCVAFLGTSRAEWTSAKPPLGGEGESAGMSLESASFLVAFPESASEHLPAQVLQWTVDVGVRYVAELDLVGSLLCDAVVDVALRLPPDEPKGWFLLLMCCPSANLPWILPCCASVLRSGMQQELSAHRSKMDSTRGELARSILRVLSRSLSLLHSIPIPDGFLAGNTASMGQTLDRCHSLLPCCASDEDVDGCNTGKMTDAEKILERLRRCKQHCEMLRAGMDGACFNGSAVLSGLSTQTSSLMQFCAERDELRCWECFSARATIHIRRPLPSCNPASCRGPATISAELPTESNAAWIVLPPYCMLSRVHAEAVIVSEFENREELTALEASSAFNLLMDKALAERQIGPQKGNPPKSSDCRSAVTRRAGGSMDPSRRSEAVLDSEKNARDAIEVSEAHERLAFQSGIFVHRQTMSDAALQRHIERVLDGEASQRTFLVFCEAEAFAVDLQLPMHASLKRGRAQERGEKDDVSGIRRGFRKRSTTVALPEGECSVRLRPTASKRILFDELQARKSLYESYDAGMESFSMDMLFDEMQALCRTADVPSIFPYGGDAALWGPVEDESTELVE